MPLYWSRIENMSRQSNELTLIPASVVVDFGLL